MSASSTADGVAAVRPSEASALPPVGNEPSAAGPLKPASIQPVKSPAASKEKRGNGDGKSKVTDQFADPEPSAMPVVLAELLDRLFTLFMTYLVVSKEQAQAATLWVAHTYMMNAAEVSPIAIINAPERACAKTLFQTILGRLVRRPLAASNATMSALFRAIGKWDVTLLIDEADTFFRDQRELHGMVNAGYQRGGTVIRSEPSGDSYEPTAFPVFGPKSIAGIALERHLHDATMSRGIHFNMRRKRADEKVQRLRDASDDTFTGLRADLARAALDFTDEVSDARPELPSDLSDRAQDNWEPLLAIAQVASAEWYADAAAAAVAMSAAVKEPPNTGNDLLADLFEVLQSWRQPTIKTTDLIEKLQADAEMGWKTYNRGQPLTPRQLAKLLSAYDIKPKTVRQPKTPLEPQGSTPKGYVVADFQDAFDRYLNDAQKVKKEVIEGPIEKSPPRVAATPQQAGRLDDADLY